MSALINKYPKLGEEQHSDRHRQSKQAENSSQSCIGEMSAFTGAQKTTDKEADRDVERRLNIDVAVAVVKISRSQTHRRQQYGQCRTLCKLLTVTQKENQRRYKKKAARNANEARQRPANKTHQQQHNGHA